MQIAADLILEERGELSQERQAQIKQGRRKIQLQLGQVAANVR